MADDDKSPPKEIIVWNEAMEQCGDDEEFLHELLGDLKIELTTQMKKIEDAMNPVNLLSIRSAAHVIKGSAGNLMCVELQWASRELEMLAKNHSEDESVDEVLVENLKMKYKELDAAAKKFQDYYDTIKEEAQ